MKSQEKKYHVDSFADIGRKLRQIGAQKIREIVSTHYYGQHEGNDVKKFVEYADRFEIHTLKEESGRFTMIEHAPITDKAAGIDWLQKQGFTHASIVNMAYTEYEYKHGTVGLYVIDDFLKSVILYYPPEQLAAIEKEFKLQNTEVISLPYNKYLDQIGKLRAKAVENL